MAAGNKLDEIRDRLQAQAEEAARAEAVQVASEDPRPKLAQKRVRRMNRFLIGLTALVVGAVGWSIYSFYMSFTAVRRNAPKTYDLKANSITSKKTQELLDQVLERAEAEGRIPKAPAPEATEAPAETQASVEAPEQPPAEGAPNPE